MPSQPSEGIDSVQGVSSEREAASMALDSIGEDVEEQELPPRPMPQSIAAELSEKERRFFALFKNTMNEKEIQASVPDDLDLKAVKKVIQSEQLPAMGDTAEQKEEKIEEMARRAAYLALQQKAEKDERYKSCHDLYVANFGNMYKKN